MLRMRRATKAMENHTESTCLVSCLSRYEKSRKDSLYFILSRHCKKLHSGLLRFQFVSPWLESTSIESIPYSGSGIRADPDPGQGAHAIFQPGFTSCPNLSALLKI